MDLHKSKSVAVEKVDICKIVGKQRGYRSPTKYDAKYYFDRMKFPPPAAGLAKIPKKDPTWDSLSKYIM